MKKRWFFAVLILAILICGTSSASFSVEMINVGAGDCFLLECDDLIMMVDNGPASAWPALQETLLRRGITRIDVLVLTHPHPDHAGNTQSLLENYTVGQVWVPGACNSAFQSSLESVLSAGGIAPVPYLRGDRFSFASCEGIVLWPQETLLELENDQSLVFRLSYKGFSCLFTGDAELETEQCLLAGKDDLPLKADLLKVGHHGMDTSTSWRLVSEVQPDFAMISCGGPEKTATVSRVTLKTLEEWNVSHVFSTMDYGNVLLSIDDNSVLTVR